MPRKFYTIDDLKQFCRANNFANFSVQQHGAPLIIHAIEKFEAADNSKDGLLDVKLKSCHIDKNRNGSGITENVMNEYKNSFKGRPILASIIKTDNGNYEFHSHDIEVDEDGNWEYIEQPVGVISQIKEPYLEYDEENDKTYLMVEGHIFEDYSKAAEILQRRKTCRCSVEIAVEEMSYNASEDYLSIDKFSFRGVTILGYEQDGETEILEGMEGSRITIDNFSEENNSMFNSNCQAKLIETLEKLNETLSMFTINNNANQEEVSEKMNHINELLTKYNVTMEDITFDYENMTDEELDAKFAELFDEGDAGSGEGEGDISDEGSEGEEPTVTEVDEVTEVEVEEEEIESHDEVDESEEDEDESEEDGVPGKKKKDEEFESDVKEKFVLQYELSHDDIRSALYSLLGAESDDGYYYTWIVEVYDNKFIYEDYTSGSFYRRSYAKDGDNVSLGDDAVEVFSEWLSKEEKDALETLKADYAALKKFREEYDAAVVKSEKEEIFAREQFAVLADCEAFKQLKADMDNFSVEEIETKAKVIYADFMAEKQNFSANKPEKKSFGSISIFNANEKPKKNRKTYGNLFDN